MQFSGFATRGKQRESGGGLISATGAARSSEGVHIYLMRLTVTVQKSSHMKCGFCVSTRNLKIWI